jgi:lysophospholipase L1-like esterase
MRLLSSMGFGLAALALVLASPGLSSAQSATSAPASQPLAVGMVEQPCAAGTSGRSPAVEMFARAMVKDGPLDLSGLKGYAQEAAGLAKDDEARIKNDWADLCRYRVANDALTGRSVKVVFLGDSITELWRAADPDMFTGGIEDRGISGQTSGQLLLRFYPDVVALHPSAVHIMVGTNDVAGNNGPNRPEDLKNNIRAMVDIAKAHKIAVVLASIPPASTFSWKKDLRPAPQIKALNTWLAEFARQEGLTYVDYYAVLVGPDGGMKEGKSRDGVHPLVSGYALMKPLAQAAIAKALGARKP